MFKTVLEWDQCNEDEDVDRDSGCEGNGGRVGIGTVIVEQLGIGRGLLSACSLVLLHQ